MTDDPILALERELVGAARRATTRRATGLGSLRLSASAVSLAAAVVVAVVLAGGALVLLGGGRHPVSSGAATGTRNQLVGMLGVLRRPQTAADLKVPALEFAIARPGLQIPGGDIDRSLIRQAAVTPWGVKAYVIPMSAPTTQQLARLPRGLRSSLRAARGERVTLFVPGSEPAMAVAPATLEQYGAVSVVPDRPPASKHPLQLTTLVPDGVARVALAFASRSGRPGSTIETVDVRGNTAAFSVFPRPSGRVVLIWLGADGSALRTVDLWRMVPALPALSALAVPGTTLTPSRLTVVPMSLTPASGSRATRFFIRVRVPVAKARFFYVLKAPAGCGSGAAGIVGGRSDEVAGRQYTISLPAPRGGWCEGTYRVTGGLVRAGSRLLRWKGVPFTVR